MIPADRPEPAGLTDRSGTFAELDRWLATARTDDAAHERSRRRWLQQMAAEEMTLAGVLIDLAEQRRRVLVTTDAGRLRRGVVTAVGRDFCALSLDSGHDVLLPLTAVASVRPSDPGARSAGDRSPGLYLNLTEALTRLVGLRPRVQALGRGASLAVTGELVTVGRDVIEVALDDRRASAYLPVENLAEVLIEAA